MTTWISQRTGQFAYFDAQLGRPDWTGKKVLDFGGNVGNILLGPDVRIEPDKYWCIDISRDAITEGQRRHPQGHFVFYDRYNFEYNPTGTAGLPIPDPGPRFDVILAWSVVSHHSQPEMLEVIGQLRGLLAPGGRLAFTFIDPQWTPPPGWARPAEAPGLSNLHWRLVNRWDDSVTEADVAALLTRAATADLSFVTLVNDRELYFDPDEDGIDPDKPQRRYNTFCTVPHMRGLFPDAQVLPPVPPERQHCVVLPGQ